MGNLRSGTDTKPNELPVVSQKSRGEYPTEHSAILELQNPSIHGFEVLEIYRSSDFEDKKCQMFGQVRRRKREKKMRITWLEVNGKLMDTRLLYYATTKAPSKQLLLPKHIS